MTITPEQFMTSSEPDEEELEPLEQVHLTEWSEVPRQGGKNMAWVIETLERIEARQMGTDVEDTAQHLADVEVKHADLYELLMQIEDIIKPSTSKLANSVRAAINAWRAPEVSAGPRVDAPPEHDADVEVWREYAVLEGLPRGEAEGLNRSQIRTALGIEQL